MKIRLVEDHQDLRKMMAGHLFDRGFVVDAVGTLDNARAALRTYRHSALIVDLSLPDGDGLSLVQSKK